MIQKRIVPPTETESFVSRLGAADTITLMKRFRPTMILIITSIVNFWYIAPVFLGGYSAKLGSRLRLRTPLLYNSPCGARNLGKGADSPLPRSQQRQSKGSARRWRWFRADSRRL